MKKQSGQKLPISALWYRCFQSRRLVGLLQLKAPGLSARTCCGNRLLWLFPQPADPYVFNLRNIPSCRMISDIFTSLAVFMSGAQTSSVGILGAGQVDKFGNVNTTKISAAGPYLVGSGGANDVASGSSEVIVTLEQSKERFLEKVDYITSPGIRVSTVVSQCGIFEKEIGGNELILTGYVPFRNGASEEESVRNIKESCGWKLKIKDKLQAISLPVDEEILFIRCFDPKRYFLGSEESKK